MALALAFLSFVSVCLSVSGLDGGPVGGSLVNNPTNAASNVGSGKNVSVLSIGQNPTGGDSLIGLGSNSNLGGGLSLVNIGTDNKGLHVGLLDIGSSPTGGLPAIAGSSSAASGSQSTTSCSGTCFICDGVRYVYNNDLVPYVKAARSCQASGGSLAAFDKNPANWQCVQKNIWAIFEKNSWRGNWIYAWIGLTRIGLGKLDFMWSDGKVATANDMVGAGADLSDYHGEEYCVHYWPAPPSGPDHKYVNGTFTWNDNQCSQNFAYLCAFS